MYAGQPSSVAFRHTQHTRKKDFLSYVYILEVSMSTFKVNVTNYDWEGLCEDLSQRDSDYLAVRHVKSKKRDHVHVFIEKPNERYKKRLKSLQDELREPHQRQGPVKQSTKEIDEEFVNYMVKEEGWRDHIVANRGFSQRELEEAHKKSEEYVQEKKEGLKAFIVENMSCHKQSPNEMYNSFVALTLEYYTREEKYIVQSPKWRILSIMLHLFPKDKDVRLYVSEKI